MLEKIRELGAKVGHFNKLKQVAIENEDYMTAKKIKAEADKVRRVVADLDPSKGFPSSGTAELREYISETEKRLSNAGEAPLGRNAILKMIQDTEQQVDQVKFDNTTPVKYVHKQDDGPPTQFKRATFKMPDLVIHKPQEKKFESSLYDFEVKVKEDTVTNNQYFTAPNPIVESYRELPPQTGVAFGPGPAASQSSVTYVSSKLDRYEDQVVPALKARKKDLDEEIQDYENFLQ